MERYSEYKDSGIKWLGDIPSHWECVRVKALFQNIREKNNPIQTEERLSLSIDKGVTLYSEKTTNLDRFKEDCSQYLLAHEDDIVLNSMNMIVGAVGKSKYFGCVSPAYYVIRLRDTSNQIDYYSQLLNIQKIRDVYRIMGKGIMAIDRGEGKVNTCRLKVPYDSFGSIKIPVPPISEQQAIVSFITKKCELIDKTILNKQKQIELLSEMKQRIIADAVIRGLNPNIKMKATNIPWQPEIPEHWDVRRIKWLFKEEDRKNTDLSYQLLSFSRTKGIVPFNEINDKAPSASDLSKYKVIFPGQLLENRMQAWSGMFGCCNIEGCVSPDYSVFSPNKGVNTEFYAYLFRTKRYIRQFANASKGIGDGFNRLYTPQFFQIYAIYPPYEEQCKIVSFIKSRSQKIGLLATKLQQEIESIKEYKQRLISDVVTGQIKVC